MHRNFGTLGRFKGDENGTVAIIVGLSFFVMVFCVGIAIDMARAYQASEQAARALDAATLAAARALRQGNPSDAEISLLAQEYFDANVVHAGNGVATFQPLTVVVDHAAGTVQASVPGSVPTSFVRIAGAGFRKLDFQKSAVATYSLQDIEVGAMLDITGSMCNPCSKIAELKTAFGKLVDALLPPVSGGKVRIGLAPFSNGFNAGPYAATVSGGRSTDGCVIERVTALNRLTDAPPVGPDAFGVKKDITTNANFAAFVAPDYGCPGAQVVPLTDDPAQLKNSVNAYVPGGGTAGHLGVTWAWNLLSPKWAGVWPASAQPAPYNDGKTIKVAILMTDGVFNTAYAQPGSLQIGQFGSTTAPIDMAKALCDNMKAQGIKIYTIGFDLSSIPGGAAVAVPMLKYCASGPANYLQADNGSQLDLAFATIAIQLNNLRLSK